MGTDLIKVHYGSDNTARNSSKFPAAFEEQRKHEPEELAEFSILIPSDNDELYLTKNKDEI